MKSLAKTLDQKATLNHHDQVTATIDFASRCKLMHLSKKGIKFCTEM